MADSLRSILIVDGDRDAREELAALVRKEVGCVVIEADTPAKGLKVLEEEDVCVLLAGHFPPNEKEGDFLKNSQMINPQAVLIASVPPGDRNAIVRVLQNGAFAYVGYPFNTGEAVIVAARALYYYDLLIYREKRGTKIRKRDGFHGIIGSSVPMQTLFELIEKIAEDGISTILIQGESGTGKELVARAIHVHSNRREKNFVPVNCAAIPEELLESELFGHVKGAFTGAQNAKMGRIQYADGGTLFLDEIGDMKPALQAKLLRVIQEKEFEPVGGLRTSAVDVRIVAATHRDLDQLVATGQFREDLYYRLSVIPITVPPLRERKDDIPLLIETFIQVFNRNRKYRLKGFGADVIAALVEYPWPGNVRELENLVQRMVVLHGGGTLRLTDLPGKYVSSSQAEAPASSLSASIAAAGEPDWTSGIDFNDLVSSFEDRLILQALRQTGGNKKEAALLLNLKRTTLLEKMKKRGL